MSIFDPITTAFLVCVQDPNLVITVPADVLAPYGTRPSACNADYKLGMTYYSFFGCLLLKFVFLFRKQCSTMANEISQKALS